MHVDLCLFVSWKAHAAVFHNCVHICSCYVIFSLVSEGNEVYMITVCVPGCACTRASTCVWKFPTTTFIFFFNFLANISQIWWGEGKPVSRIFFSENFLSFRHLGKNAREQETLEEVLWDTREKSCCKWPNLWKILNLSCHLL